MSYLSRRDFLKACASVGVAASGGVVASGGVAFGAQLGRGEMAEANIVEASVDFGRAVASVSPYHVGTGSTTYGATPITSDAQAAVEAQLDARCVRLPVGVRNGRVTSSAGGGPTDLDVPRLVNWYREHDTRVLAVLGGRTNDIDIAPGDAAQIARALGFDGVEYSNVNEPNNQKLTLDDTLLLARRSLSELRALRPNAQLWGPEWTWYDRGALKTFAQSMGDGLAGVCYHHYAMGVDSVPTPKALASTLDWGRETREVLADLRELGLPPRASVTEFNLSWRYADGTPPNLKNERFFSSVNTVFVASVLGHALSSGASALVYGTQNGALGVTTDTSPEVARFGFAPSSPMPAYWGVAAWTGAKLWPHLRDALFQVEMLNANAEIELFACNNEANGYNLVAINKSEAPQTLRARLQNLAPGEHDLWQSDSTRPFEAPRQTQTQKPYTDTLSLSLPPMSVSVSVLRPRR